MHIVGGNDLTMKSGVDVRNEGSRSEVEREMASASVERKVSEQSSSHGEGFCLGFLADPTLDLGKYITVFLVKNKEE